MTQWHTWTAVLSSQQVVVVVLVEGFVQAPPPKRQGLLLRNDSRVGLLLLTSLTTPEACFLTLHGGWHGDDGHTPRFADG